MIGNMDIITTFDQCLSCFRDMDPAQGYCSVVLIKIIASVSLQINMVLHVRRCVNGVRICILIDPNPNGWSGLGSRRSHCPVHIINVHACHLLDACGHGHGGVQC